MENWANAIHVERVQRRGDADVGGAERWVVLVPKRLLGGNGLGERRGCVDVYDLRRCASRPVCGAVSACSVDDMTAVHGAGARRSVRDRWQVVDGD